MKVHDRGSLQKDGKSGVSTGARLKRLEGSPVENLRSRNAWRERNLWYIVPVLPIAIAAVATELGASMLYTSIAVFVLFLWLWLAHQEGPSPDEDPEYGFLRNTRVKLYFVGLLFYTFLNVALLSMSIWVALVFSVLYPIRTAVLIMIHRFLMAEDRRAVNPRNSREEECFKEMCMRVGGSTIYLTWAIFWVDMLLALRSVDMIIPTVSGAFLTVMPVLYFVIVVPISIGWSVRRAWIREVESRSHARTLAGLLRERRWSRAFNRKRSKGA